MNIERAKCPSMAKSHGDMSARSSYAFQSAAPDSLFVVISLSNQLIGLTCHKVCLGFLCFFPPYNLSILYPFEHPWQSILKYSPLRTMGQV